MEKPKNTPTVFSQEQLPKILSEYRGKLWNARNKLFRASSLEGSLQLRVAPTNFVSPEQIYLRAYIGTGIKGKSATREDQRVFRVLPLRSDQQAAVRMGILSPAEVENVTYLFQSPELWVIDTVRLLMEKRHNELSELYHKKSKELEDAAYSKNREAHLLRGCE